MESEKYYKGGSLDRGIPGGKIFALKMNDRVERTVGISINPKRENVDESGDLSRRLWNKDIRGIGL